MNKTARNFVRTTFFGLSALTTGLLAQETAAPAASTEMEEDEDIIMLSPFEVEAGDTGGYTAKTTLAGNRLRTDLADIASPLSVVTEEFLTDTASRDNQDLLKYTTNTEVGGIYGDYGGYGGGHQLDDRGSLLRPNENTRVRGLEQADNTRNFFLTDIPWDGYNVDRVDIQRGPNSILFGVGSPAGIINAGTKVARMDGNKGEAALELGSYGSNRWTIDYNWEVVDDELAIRMAALYNDKQYRQDPAFTKNERVYGTLTWQPQLLDESWASRTTVRATGEWAKITANNPRSLPPVDGITLWFDDRAGDGVVDPIGMGKELSEPFIMNSNGFGNAQRAYNNGGLDGSHLDAYIIPGYNSIDSGALNNGGVGLFYINGSDTPYLAVREAPREYPGAIGPDGSVDNVVSGVPFGSNIRGGSWNQYSKNVNWMDLMDGRESRFPLADRNYYKDRSLTDDTVFDFHNQLIDGDNKRELSDWQAGNVSVAQTFMDNRFGLEVVYDYQSYNEKRQGLSWSRPYISVDINKNRQSVYPQYDQVDDPNSDDPEDTVLDRSTYRVPGFTPTANQPYSNPMTGAAFLGGGASANNSAQIDRKTTRVTGFAELRFSDFMDEDSWLTRMLGTHTFTGLYTHENRYREEAQWRPNGMTYEWARPLSVDGAETKVNESARITVPIVYLSGPLTDSSITSAAGLNLPPVRSIYNPSGTIQASAFISTWNRPTDPEAPGYVDPSAQWINIFGDWDENVGFESENFNNYQGYTTMDTYILNEATDIDQLYHDFAVRNQTIKSTGFTWQGRFLDGDLVPTVGWRRDQLVTYTGAGAEDATGIVTPEAEADLLALENEGDTTSWGVVYHLRKSWMENVPLFSGMSLYYNEGRNNKVEARYNFDGNPLDNPSADSTDYGIVLRMLDDKMSLKIGKYKTEVKNGNLPGGASLIGSEQYYIMQLEAWGTASALIDLYGYNGLDVNQPWYWNWANNQDPDNIAYDIDPLSDEYRNHPVTIQQMAAVDDFIKGMDQAFYDNYDIPINVASFQAAYATGDINAILAEVGDVFPVGSYATGLNAKTTINGITPNGTIDNTSEGYEVEFNYQPVPNWNIQVNASKTTAYREQLGAPMSEFINAQYERFQGPAGDLRIWWAGEKPIQNFYEDNIISALLFQEESVGSQAPELRPYKFRVITNYAFQEGFLKRFTVGGAWRWQDNQVIGYGLKDDRSGLDVNNVFYSEKEGFVDLWASYNFNLTEKINWKIQLNLRNVGESPSITPLTANPDGSVAAVRMKDGMTWALTNTFSF